MPDIEPTWTDPERTPIDFIIVGAGAGGAPLAARLAERGYTVLVTEMGPARPSRDKDAVVENTEVPLLHAETTEDHRHSLRFFVKHFDHDPDQSLDPKLHGPEPGTQTPNPDDEKGIFYPRAQGIGGCTIHNAMITVSGPSEDWDQITEATGDESWRGERMRAYFERLEHCHYNRPAFPWLRRILGLSTGWEGDRHGTRGWLQTTVADLSILLNDRGLLRVVLDAVGGTIESGIEDSFDLLRSAFTGRAFPQLDPNNWQTMRQGGEGLARIPCAITPEGKRSDARTRLEDVKGDPNHGKRLLLLTETCVTGIELKEEEQSAVVGGVQTRTRAVGIRCIVQPHLYEADVAARAPSDNWMSQQIKLYCRREVILSGGAFNTPQLLMLSGVGPKDQLDTHNITCVRNLPGVGENLQDRYEVPVIATVKDEFRSLRGLGVTSHGDVATHDPLLQRWIQNDGKPSVRRGVYATNGGLIGIFKRSSQEDAVPDLFIFALAANFPGYHVGYSTPAAFTGLPPGTTDAQAAAAPKKKVSWILLKARTHQHMGYVRLRSISPFRRPEINFRSFPLGDDDPDMKALVEGIAFVKNFLEQGKQKGEIAEYGCPDENDPRFGGDMRKWVRNIAWGHHACGTCRIGGDDDELAVLDSRFRVRGVKGLRVVDACVFPRIPGFFIVTNVYMVAEKAADVLTEDHPLPPGKIPPECLAALTQEPVLRSRAEFEARRVYPAEMEAREAELIADRRYRAGL
jgi:choline dehydrogenase